MKETFGIPRKNRTDVEGFSFEIAGGELNMMDQKCKAVLRRKNPKNREKSPEIQLTIIVVMLRNT